MLQWEGEAEFDPADQELDMLPRYDLNKILMFRVALIRKAGIEEVKDEY